jgi:uncharacterized membrane protein YhhN
MQTAWLTVLTIVSAVIHLRAEYLGPEWQIYVFKPLTVVCILLFAVLVERPVSSSYKRWIIVALGLSLVGDVLLMLPVDLFLPGLVVFLLAHIVYASAFFKDTPYERGPAWTQIPYLFYFALLTSILLPELNEMSIPVMVYAVVICMMGWLALRRWRMAPNLPALLAAVGALFFLLSDTALAVNRFLQPFEAAPAVVLITYYIAQYLLARSVAPGNALPEGKPA